LHEFSTPSVFQEHTVPRATDLVGWAALVQAYGLQAPVRAPSCVSAGFVKGSRRTEDGWTIFDKRFKPAATLGAHIMFALRHEPLDLLILKRLFAAVPAVEIQAVVRTEPTGANARRLWFFLEWLTGNRLDIPDAEAGNYVDAIDPRQYFAASPANSPRHRVRNNLLGVAGFCPIIRHTPALDDLLNGRWDIRAKDLIGTISKEVIARAASFLLLADSQASYQIEGERPPRNRLERWMRAVAQAGQRHLSVDELVRLQHIVIEDQRFVRPGLRDEGGFVGGRDANNSPLPEFVSARHEDVPKLLNAIIEANTRMSGGGVDAVLQAAATAFGFVFVHPFVDGNGRIHRYLIHHVLAERGYTPPGVTFPVSSVLLDRIEEYGATLRAFSGSLMPFIEWRPTPKQNVEVLNDTSDLYRFGDYTDVAAFLYACVAQTITEDLPREIAFLQSYDTAKTRIQDMLDMPEAILGNLINMIRQNGGKLSKNRRQKEFAALTDSEVAAVEGIVAEAFALAGVEPKQQPASSS